MVARCSPEHGHPFAARGTARAARAAVRCPPLSHTPTDPSDRRRLLNPASAPAPTRSNLYKTERDLPPVGDYLGFSGAADGLITPPGEYVDRHMRRVAVSWLVEVADEFKLHQQTLFLAIALLDRFLSASQVSRTRAAGAALRCIGAHRASEPPSRTCGI